MMTPKCPDCNRDQDECVCVNEIKQLQEVTDVPTLKEEVERKALEALEMIAIDRDMGKITEAQYSYALTVLWASCAGIAGSDFTIMMEVAKPGVKDSSFQTVVIFHSPLGRTVKITNFHTGLVTIKIMPSILTHYDYQGEIGGYEKAKEKFQSLCEKLLANGYTKF